MTIKELITQLQEYDADLLVVRSGYEGGVQEIREIEKIGVKLNVNKEWYYGKHEETHGDEKPDVLVIKIE